MPIKKLQIKAGVNRENTRYTNEGGWYESNNVRFRQGYPEKIGGWAKLTEGSGVYSYVKGYARALLRWTQLSGVKLLGIGTDDKYYVEQGGVFTDITPLRVPAATINNGPFSQPFTYLANTLMLVHDDAHGANRGDYVTFSGATGLGGAVTADVLNTNHRIFFLGKIGGTTADLANYYYILLGVIDPSGATGNGGNSVVAAYEIHVSGNSVAAASGWGSGLYGFGDYGVGLATVPTSDFRTWNHANFGETLLASVPFGPLYKWQNDLSARMVAITGSGAPTTHSKLLISDTSRFVFVFGTNPYGSGTFDPMLLRWSSQETFTDWQPLATNSAGSLRLSRGSEILAVKQSRQEILVWTDSALYSLQFLGGVEGWGARLVGENISVASKNSVAYANGTAFWMGREKFYSYTGETQTLPCDLRSHVFTNINTFEYEQTLSGTNEGFNEIWWFYASLDSDNIISPKTDKYVIYNYVDNIWYYGDMERASWIDEANEGKPISAQYQIPFPANSPFFGANQGQLLLQEIGVDDNSGDSEVAIPSFITSSEFDIDDGDRFSFVSKVIPDLNFRGSTSESPSLQMTLTPLHDSGSGYNNPVSVGGNSTLPVIRSATVPVEIYTAQLNLRVRGRQMSIKLESTDLGVHWQLGSPRLDVRPDGRR
jgi:hypothetical protein|tara:strand:- start:587 stop:2551 length:1965 start_codon:yes stop_codon:yes gene_type:complete